MVPTPSKASGPSPYDFDSPEGCAVQCAKGGFVNMVGFQYEKATSTALDAEDELEDIDVHACFCLVPDGAADCSGFVKGDYDLCNDVVGNGKGPIAFTLDKDTHIENNSFAPLYFFVGGYFLESEEIAVDSCCIRNDNFDPDEPTLGAKFPLPKSSKSAKKGTEIV